MSNWKQISVGEFIEFNPFESIKKNTKAKKIGMDKLGTFQRKINGYEIEEYSAGPKFRNGDTVVAKITPCLENGKTAFVDILEEDEVAYGSSEFIVLRRNKNSDSKFIYYLARSPWFRERAISCMEGTSGRKRVNEGALKRQEILVPTIKEQQKIAAVLSALDDKIELNNKINAELEAMAKTLYDYWFVQFEFPNAEGKPYKSSGGKMVYNPILKREIPEGWEVKTIGDVIEKIESGKRPKGGIDKSLKNGIPSLGAENIDRLGYFNYSNTKFIPFDYKEKIISGIIQNNDILIYKDGAYVGKTTLFRDNFPFEFAVINEHVFLVRSLFPKFQEYLLFTLMQESYFNIMQKLGQKAAQPGLNQEDLKSIKIIVPPKDLIIDFSEKIDVYFKKLFLNSKQNQELSALRDWLLPMLMNGQVRVEDIEKEEEINMAAVSSTRFNSPRSKNSSNMKFEQWLQYRGLAARGDVDKDTLLEIFNAMDDEDK